MTTLPQTTTLRLPRPAAAQIAIPGAPMLHGGPMAAPAGNIMTGADVWRVIRANLWLIALVMLLAGGAGYGVNTWLDKNYPRYTSDGFIQINPPPQLDPLRQASDGGYNAGFDISLELRSQAALLSPTNSTLLDEVIQSGDVRGTDWFKSFPTVQKAKEDLQDKLEVMPAEGSKFIHIAMSDRDPKSCQIIAKTWGDRHIQDQQKLLEGKQANRSIQLTNQKVTYQAQLADVQAQIRDDEKQLASRGGRTSEAMGLSAKDLELTTLVTEQLKAQMAKQVADAQYDGLTNSLAAGQDSSRIEAAVSNDPDVQSDRRAVEQLKIAIASAKTNYDSENPSVKSLESRLDLYQQQLADHTAEARGKARNAALEEAKSEKAAAQSNYDQLTKRVEQNKGDMAELARLYASYLFDRDQEQSIQQILKQYNDQLGQIASFQARQSAAAVDWSQTPRTPDVRSFPKLKVTMTVALMMGLALSLGIAFLRELMDTSIRSPRDITRVGSLNLLGMVPHESDDPQAASVNLPLVIFEAPQSMIAEQLRQVRTRLQHSSSLDTTRTILVTSPGPGDGKTTIAANLASGLALNGRRILLVDANFHRPGLHKIFNLANDQGFADVLNSLDNFDGIVRETQVPNLYLLPSGMKPANATELLESQLLLDFIERALEEFDHVIFDSGPVMFVSETVALAPRVDGVLTVVRARHNSRGVLQRMRDNLRQVKAEHLGVVLNAVRSQGGGYYASNIRTYYDYQKSRVA